MLAPFDSTLALMLSNKIHTVQVWYVAQTSLGPCWDYRLVIGTGDELFIMGTVVNAGPDVHVHQLSVVSDTMTLVKGCVTDLDDGRIFSGTMLFNDHDVNWVHRC